MITNLIQNIANNKNKNLSIFEINLQEQKIKVFNNFNMTANKYYKNMNNTIDLENNFIKFFKKWVTIVKIVLL